jgi:hypothetical protein
VYENEDDQFIFIFEVETGNKLHFTEYFGQGISPNLNWSIRVTNSWMVRHLKDKERLGRIIIEKKDEHLISKKRFFDINSKYVGFETEDNTYKIFRVFAFFQKTIYS